MSKITMMQVAKTQVDNRKKKSIVLTILVMSTGVISAALLILFNRNQASQTPAATLPAPSIAVCSMQGNCQWDPLQIEGIVYTYTIIDKATGSPITSGRTSTTRVTFNTRADHSYECTVAALSSCGQGETTTNSCGPKSSQSQTTATASATIIPTATATATLVPTTKPGLSLTPTIKPGSTATLSTQPIGGGSNPTATPILIVQSTNTPGPSATKTPTSAPTTGSSSASSLPQAGTLLPTIALLSISSLIIIVGLLL